MNLTFFDLALVALAGTPGMDDFEEYLAGAIVSWAGGHGWDAPGLVYGNFPGLRGVEDFEGGTDGGDANGLNDGWGFAGALKAGENLMAVRGDSMESYADGADVNGLNGASGWGSAYVAR